MIENICKRELCTGCAACFSVCPKGCIQMQADQEGFLRPFIDPDECISCEKCKITCPVNHPVKDDGIIPQAYAVRIIDKQILEKSSSGGVFTAFAEYVLSNFGVVVGAGFDDDFRVVHKVCTDITALDEIRRSKYVQSEIRNTFKEVKLSLDEGRKVLFCGTPCQVGGLKAYLGKEYENLYAVDFICHGVPSPKAWERYKDYLNANADNLKTVSMRSKRCGWKLYSMYIEYRDGSVFSKKVDEDFYLRSFIMDLDLRPSCYNCQFKQIHRESDITIADYWGVEKQIPEWNDDAGVSLVLAHSQNGAQLLEAVRNRCEMISVPFSDAVASNPSVSNSVKQSPLRKAFMKDLDNLPFDKLFYKYCGSGISSKLRRGIANYFMK